MEPNFLDESLSESNFDLTPSLQDRLDNFKDFDLISDSSSLCASNSFSLRRMDSGLDPKVKSPTSRNPFDDSSRTSFDIFPEPMHLSQIPSPAMQASFFKKSSPVDDEQKFELYKSLPDEKHVGKPQIKRKSRGSLMTLGSKPQTETEPRQFPKQVHAIQTHNNININNFHFGPEVGALHMANFMPNQSELMNPAQYQQIYNELTLGQGGKINDSFNNHRNSTEKRGEFKTQTIGKPRLSAFDKYKRTTGLEDIEEENENSSLAGSVISQEQISFALNSSKKLQNLEILSQFTGNDYSVKSGDSNPILSGLKNSFNKPRKNSNQLSPNSPIENTKLGLLSSNSVTKSPHSPILDILSPENHPVSNSLLNNNESDSKTKKFIRKVPEFQPPSPAKIRNPNELKSIKIKPRSFEIETLKMPSPVYNRKKSHIHTQNNENLKSYSGSLDPQISNSPQPQRKNSNFTDQFPTSKIPLKPSRKIHKLRLKDLSPQKMIQDSPQRHRLKNRSKSPTIDVYKNILKSNTPNQQLDIQKQVAENLASRNNIAMSMSIERDQFRKILKHARSDKNVKIGSVVDSHISQSDNTATKTQKIPLSTHDNDVVVIKKRKLRKPKSRRESLRAKDNTEIAGRKEDDVVIRVRTRSKKIQKSKVRSIQETAAKLINWNFLENSLKIIQNMPNWEASYVNFQSKFKFDFIELNYSISKNPKLVYEIVKSYLKFSKKSNENFTFPNFQTFEQKKSKYRTEVIEEMPFPQKRVNSNRIDQQIIENEYKKHILEDKNDKFGKFLLKGFELKFFCLSHMKLSEFSQILNGNINLKKISKNKNLENKIQIQSVNGKKDVEKNKKKAHSELDSFLFGNFGPCAFPLKMKSLKKLSSLRGINLKNRKKIMRRRSEIEKKEFLNISILNKKFKTEKKTRTKDSKNQQNSSYPKDKLKFVRKSRPNIKKTRKSRSKSRKRNYNAKKNINTTRKRSSSFSKIKDTNLKKNRFLKNKNKKKTTKQEILEQCKPQNKNRSRRKSTNKSKSKTRGKSKKMDNFSKDLSTNKFYSGQARTNPKFALKNKNSKILPNSGIQVSKKPKLDYQSDRPGIKKAKRKRRALTPHRQVRNKRAGKNPRFKKMINQTNQKSEAIHSNKDPIVPNFVRTETDFNYQINSDTLLTLDSDQSNSANKDFLSREQNKTSEINLHNLKKNIEIDMIEGLTETENEFLLISNVQNSFGKPSPVCSLGHIEVKINTKNTISKDDSERINKSSRTKSGFQSQKLINRREFNDLLKKNKVSDNIPRKPKRKKKGKKTKKKKIEILAQRGDLSPNPRSSISQRSKKSKSKNLKKKKKQNYVNIPNKKSNPKTIKSKHLKNSTKITTLRQSERISPEEESDSYFQKYRLKKMNSQGPLKMVQDIRTHNIQTMNSLNSKETDPYGLVWTSIDLQKPNLNQKNQNPLRNMKKQKSNRIDFASDKSNKNIKTSKRRSNRVNIQKPLKKFMKKTL